MTRDEFVKLVDACTRASVRVGSDLPAFDSARTALLAAFDEQAAEVEALRAERDVARLGQNRKVIVEYGIAEGTIDERISEILLAKLPALEKVINQDEVKSFGRELIGADDPGIMIALAEKILNRGRKVDDE